MVTGRLGSNIGHTDATINYDRCVLANCSNKKPMLHNP